jgi:hypothetical protein
MAPSPSLPKSNGAIVLRTKVDPQPTLWEAILPPEFTVLPPWTCAHRPPARRPGLLRAVRPVLQPRLRPSLHPDRDLPAHDALALPLCGTPLSQNPTRAPPHHRTRYFSDHRWNCTRHTSWRSMTLRMTSPDSMASKASFTSAKPIRLETRAPRLRRPVSASCTKRGKSRRTREDP